MRSVGDRAIGWMRGVILCLDRPQRLKERSVELGGETVLRAAVAVQIQLWERTARPSLLVSFINALSMARCGSGEWWMRTWLQARASSSENPGQRLFVSVDMLHSFLGHRVPGSNLAGTKWHRPVLPLAHPVDDGLPRGRPGTDGHDS